MSRKRKNNQKKPGAPTLHSLNPNAAGVDIGATQIYIAVPANRDPQPVRQFSTFTEDLHSAAAWLKACQIETVAMESTGVYWIPFFQILEARGFKVLLVNAHHVRMCRDASRMFPTANGCSICIRWVCSTDRSVQLKRSAPSVRSSAIGTIWCKWPRVTCNTCKRRWIR